MENRPRPSREFFETLLACAQGRAELGLLQKEPLERFLDLVLDVVAAEPSCIEWEPREMVVVGDTHGDYRSTNHLLDAYPSTPLVFLGDYSGRSQEKFDDIRNCLLVFVAKLLTRDRIILLRGNHDDEFVSSENGLLRSLREMLGAADGEAVWKKFTAIFHQLPVSLVMKDLIVLHGALPKVGTLDEIRRIPKGTPFVDQPLLTQVLWNDVTTQDRVADSERCPGALIYGRTTLQELLAAVGRKVLIHGHNYAAKGVGCDGADICLYTCETYFYLPLGTPGDPADVQTPVPGNLIAHYDGQETIAIRALPAFHLGEVPLHEVRVPADGPPSASPVSSLWSSLFRTLHARCKPKG